MRYLTPIIAALLASLLAQSPAFAEQGRLSVRDDGLDGEARYYNVTCPKGKQERIVHLFLENKVCSYDAEGNRQCLTTGDVDAVAQKICAGK